VLHGAGCGICHLLKERAQASADAHNLDKAETRKPRSSYRTGASKWRLRCLALPRRSLAFRFRLWTLGPGPWHSPCRWRFWSKDTDLRDLRMMCRKSLIRVKSGSKS
jgi:hypothetical protein